MERAAAFPARTWLASGYSHGKSAAAARGEERQCGGRGSRLLLGGGRFGQEQASKEADADPRAMGVFAVVCVLTAQVLYAALFKVLLLGMVFFYLRHPRFSRIEPNRSTHANLFLSCLRASSSWLAFSFKLFLG